MSDVELLTNKMSKKQTAKTNKLPKQTNCQNKHTAKMQTFQKHWYGGDTFLRSYNFIKKKRELMLLSIMHVRTDRKDCRVC